MSDAVPDTQALESLRLSALLRGSAVAAACGALALGGSRWIVDGPGSEPALVLFAAGAAFGAIVVLAGIWPQVARRAMVFTPWLALTALSTLDGGLQSDAVYWMPFIPLVAAFFLGGRASLIFAGLAISSLVGVWLLPMSELLPMEAPTRTGMRFLAASGAISFGGVMGWIYEGGRQRSVAALVHREEAMRDLISALPDAVVPLAGIGGDIPSRRVPEEALAVLSGLRVGVVARVESGPAHYAVRKVRVGEGFVGLVRDVTAELAIARLKDDFIRTISHELRSPVTAVHGSLQLLEGLADPGQQELVDVAIRNAQRLSFLVSDLADLQSSKGSGVPLDMRFVDLELQLVDAVSHVRVAAKAADVHIDLQAPRSVEVNADTRRFGQVLNHVLDNAVAHSPKGGRVRVSTVTVSDGWTRIHIADQGPGIPASFRERVFLPFTQADASTSRVRHGSGIGMAVANQLVLSMGWRIGFDTEVGAGTTFWIEMPHRMAGSAESNREAMS